jgi:hypothetical protein
LDKPAGTRCKHQTRHGCACYADLEVVAPDCRLWNCRWLVDPDATGLRRPDHAHYVIDIMPDFIGVQDDTGRVEDIAVMQVWCDPDYPDAWRDQALRRYAERMAAERHEAILVRFGAARAIAVIPPSMSIDGKWQEKESHMNRGDDTGWTNPLDAMRRHGGLRRGPDGAFTLDRARLRETADRALALLGGQRP